MMEHKQKFVSFSLNTYNFPYKDVNNRNDISDDAHSLTRSRKTTDHQLRDAKREASSLRSRLVGSTFVKSGGRPKDTRVNVNISTIPCIITNERGYTLDRRK